MSYVLPANVPKREGQFLARLSAKILQWCGWRIEGQLPDCKQFIIAVAPHTSNWDFFLGILVMFRLQLKVKFLGKHSIFVWPVKGLLQRIGGIPVEREHRHGVVGQMVEYFERGHPLVLALAPEGTRSKVNHWKTGFLHIANQANVPVVPIAFDFRKKAVIIMPSVEVNEDIEQARIAFQQLFTDVCAKNPHLA
ncbi:1-acyl-sn-glycerol-3-phosphate acyltransferase [Thalassotalea piscium]|uniref:1-acyl-sn-glycerol-3-phosphate acyltransferase n=1 Tax=Thalassotalea piscium TaxID=1230533 RepID=A0A7X0TTT1_9GAMM|nr:1-acyl-sn-glycerol-3-phosphate acyltransferase [Thalassotalea piscium]MBB6543405.1 1-acyl-sn-glycerol-3-phosphate acyltransferase [Thalassotalea piscium]